MSNTNKHFTNAILFSMMTFSLIAPARAASPSPLPVASPTMQVAVPNITVSYAGKTISLSNSSLKVDLNGNVVSNINSVTVPMREYEFDRITVPQLTALKKSVANGIIALQLIPLHGIDTVIDHLRGSSVVSQTKGTVLGYSIDIRINASTGKVLSSTVIFQASDLNQPIIQSQQ